MARRQARPAAAQQYRLAPHQRRCAARGGPAHVAYRRRRTVATREGLDALTLVVRRCQEPACALDRRASRPDEEGHWAPPQGEFGLDVLALVGARRFAGHRSVPEIHQSLTGRGVALAERTVTWSCPISPALPLIPCKPALPPLRCLLDRAESGGEGRRWGAGCTSWTV